MVCYFFPLVCLHKDHLLIKWINFSVKGPLLYVCLSKTNCQVLKT